ncbi:MAG TPA: hypothetical protein VKU02_32875, partial [Gemmataceae bacterium]|nr:hypothetical protein [Gemmataceae bacterium]
IVGQYFNGSRNLGFLLSGGSYTTLNFPGSTETEANAINNAGQIVGFYYDAAGRLHGFLLSDGTYTTVDVPGAGTTLALGLNDAGLVVGYYEMNGPFFNEHSFLATPTPEPCNLLLLGIGVLAILAYGWRKRRVISGVSA